MSGEFSRISALRSTTRCGPGSSPTRNIGYENDDYVGLGRTDNHYFAATGLTYKLNREMQLKGEVRQDWLNSNVSGAAYTAITFLLTMRLQK